MTKTVAVAAPAGGSTDVTRFNALRHGVLSRYTVLPWEDADAYGALLDALVAEHAPQGPTEEHLVEELAGTLWRKRRLRQAEAAAHRHGLERTLAPYSRTAKAALVHVDGSDPTFRVGEAIRSADDRDAHLADIATDEAQVAQALAVLRSGRSDAFDEAVPALPEATREWWQEALQPEEVEPEERTPFDWNEHGGAYTADGAGLARFLTTEVQPWLATLRKQEEQAPLIREQAFGESLDPDKLGRLARYEVHLDRKLERTLAMLLKLKELRAGTGET